MTLYISGVHAFSAGGVLSCVDSVMADEAWSGWAIARPPGHHADTSTSSGIFVKPKVELGSYLDQ